MLGFVLPYLYISQLQELLCSICMPCKLVITSWSEVVTVARRVSFKLSPYCLYPLSWLDQAPLHTADNVLTETIEDPHFEFLKFLTFPFNNFLPIDGASINRFSLM